MKKIVLTLLVAAVGIVTVQAQEIPERKSEFRPHHRPDMPRKKQMANLNLTEEQKAKYKELAQEERKQFEALDKQDNITVKEAREKRVAIQKEFQDKRQSLLTTEQKAQIEKDKEARKEKTREYGKRHDDKMKERLGLTDEQAAKLSESRKAFGEKMRTIREDKALSET
ncbi:MAG TPA: hypothetical protein VHM26_06430, partial [Chitinophagaceae bacterium]|nr:hypothetical protein [Chitinophagaceae bacterium]